MERKKERERERDRERDRERERDAGRHVCTYWYHLKQLLSFHCDMHNFFCIFLFSTVEKNEKQTFANRFITGSFQASSFEGSFGPVVLFEGLFESWVFQT